MPTRFLNKATVQPCYPLWIQPWMARPSSSQPWRLQKALIFLKWWPRQLPTIGPTWLWRFLAKLIWWNEFTVWPLMSVSSSISALTILDQLNIQPLKTISTTNVSWWKIAVLLSSIAIWIILRFLRNKSLSKTTTSTVVNQATKSRTQKPLAFLSLASWREIMIPSSLATSTKKML